MCASAHADAHAQINALKQLKTADAILGINKQTFLSFYWKIDVLQFHYMVLQNAKLILT